MRSILLLSIVLLVAGSAGAAAANKGCTAFSDTTGWIDFTPCTRVDASGGRVVKAKHLRGLSFDKYGVATARMMNGFYYVGRDGRMVPVIPFDNGPDYFVEGLARTQADGKIGYIDRKLRLVIPPHYDWGFPFEGGKAAVCNGCRPKSVDAEHSIVVGGLWGAIDRRGREIVPLQYHSLDELPK